MIERLLDKEMGLRLFYRESFQGKPTLISLPGFGTRQSARPMERAVSVSDLLFDYGHLDVNLASFDYPSHRTNLIDGFGADHKEVAKVASKLRELGVDSRTTGIVGGCYGSYVGGKFLEEGGQTAFAALIGPFFGRNSLNWWGRALLDLGKVPGLSVPFRKLFKDGNGRRINVNIRNLLEYVSGDLDLSKSAVDTLILGVKAHNYFAEDPFRGISVNPNKTSLLNLPDISDSRKAIITSADFIRDVCYR